MVVEIMVLGVGATLSMDLWALLRRRWFGVASLDYGWVGRWLGHMRHGQFRHAAIAKAAPLRGERLLGWGFHYLTGLVFAPLSWPGAVRPGCSVRRCCPRCSSAWSRWPRRCW